MPEGSILPASYMKHKAHGLATHPSPSSPKPVSPVSAQLPCDFLDPNNRPPLRRASFGSRADLHRESHVLDLKIQLPLHDKQRRWSISSPTKYVSAELVKSRLESQRFDALMRDDVDSVAASHSQDEEMVVPEIRVSTSSSTMPVSLPSPVTTPSRSTPLAVRRGVKVPSPLTLKKSGPLEVDPCPSIPSAFRGSPVEYSPLFSLAAGPSSPTEVDDMINNLRSRVVDMQPLTPQDIEMSKSVVTVSASNSASSLPSVSLGPSRTISGCLGSDDEWAFAREFMASSGDPLPVSSPRKTSSAANTPVSHSRPETRAMTVKSKISVPAPKPQAAHSIRPKSTPAIKEARSPLPSQRDKRMSVRPPRVSDIPVRPRSRTSGANGPASHKSSLTSPRPLSPVSAVSDVRYRPHTPEQKVAVQTHAPPTPATPSQCASTPSQDPKRIQGILKYTKNVRFAAPPSKAEDQDRTALLAQPLDGSTRGSLKAPSPLRQSFAPRSLETPAAGGPQTRARARMSLAVEKPNRRMSMAPVSDRRRTLDPSTICTPLEMQSLRSGAFNTLPSRIAPTPAGHSPAATPDMVPRAKTRGRRSLSLLSGGSDAKQDKNKGKEQDKENRSPFRLSLASSPKRRVGAGGGADENKARRVSVAVAPTSASEGGSWSGRGRLSSPLKSILGKLRS
ncbi:hypothetical protein OF83DRAFT_31118 [Amylostereum chailletii]|nr:hypothetical protein OF83DRAFT_31118 [Amylostereum chailletii]